MQIFSKNYLLHLFSPLNNFFGKEWSMFQKRDIHSNMDFFCLRVKTFIPFLVRAYPNKTHFLALGSNLDRNLLGQKLCDQNFLKVSLN